ncbi:hypothetical protein TRFO_23311 [Tritrichomonas foetus]|uniref:DNA 3'-5' helicase n=1 Tax=Tritrichomonas foetus TaxID=1144522 RepID=A0A1J4KBA0_9EUKA|nr:hypothetical protein TRFO_23311 [Tritrichomonas foetus]|eukprot:OHT08234.1 hypothetical protein TRFO_23311 [Tritrichomonas foetus]
MEDFNFSTNFKTIKREILGKYHKMKYAGMVWSDLDSPIFINTNIFENEQEITKIFSSNYFKNQKSHKNVLEMFNYVSEPENEILLEESGDCINSPIFMSASDTNNNNDPTIISDFEITDSNDFSRSVNMTKKFNENASPLLEEVQNGKRIYCKTPKLVLENENEEETQNQNNFSTKTTLADLSSSEGEPNFLLSDFQSETTQTLSLDDQIMKIKVNYLMDNNDLTPYETKILINIIKNNENSLIIDPADTFYSSFLYLIPGILKNDTSLIITSDYETAKKHVKYLKSLNLNADGLFNENNIVTESGIILVKLLKSQINFLFIYSHLLQNDNRLTMMLHATHLKNPISRIFFVNYDFKLKNQSCVMNFNDFLQNMKSLFTIPNLISPTFIILKSNLSEHQQKIEIIEQISQQNIFFISPIIQNVYYEVINKKGLSENIKIIINWLELNKYEKCSGIVFCVSVSDSEALSSLLNENHINTAFLHSKMSLQMHKEVENNFLNGAIDILVVVYDLSFNIHRKVEFLILYSIPSSIEEFFKHTKRLKNNEFISHCLILFNEIDVVRLKRLIYLEQSVSQNTLKCSNKDLSFENDVKNMNDNHYTHEQFVDDNFGDLLIDEMADFCREKNECRRVLLVKKYQTYLNDETLKDCHTMCDNCVKKNSGLFKEIDGTGYAKSLVDLIRRVEKNDLSKKYLTIQSIVSIFTGKQNWITRKIKSDKIGCFGAVKELCGKEMVIKEIIKELLNRGILTIQTKFSTTGKIEFLCLSNHHSCQITTPIKVLDYTVDK